MTKRVIKASIDFLLLKSRHLREVNLVYFGGEPLMVFDRVKFATEYCGYYSRMYGKVASLAMATNGTLFNDEKLRYCRDHSIKFLLSIDGDKETHNQHRKLVNGKGSYDAAVEKIGLMKSYQPWLGARVTPTPDSMHKLTANIQHLYSLGINQFIIGPATGLHYTENDIWLFREELKKLGNYYVEQSKAKAPFRLILFEQWMEDAPGAKQNIWGCGAGRGRLSVSTSGEIQPCAKVQGLNDLAGIPLFSLGNVMTGFGDLNARREFISFHYDRRTACHKCDLMDDCMGGCPAVNFQSSGCIWLPNPCECKITRVIIEAKREIRRKLSELPTLA